jgi:hypothetical protein
VTWGASAIRRFCHADKVEEEAPQRRMIQPAVHPRRFERYATCVVARTCNRLDRSLKAIETACAIETEIGPGENVRDRQSHIRDAL